MTMNLRKQSIVIHLVNEGQFKSTRKETVMGKSIPRACRVGAEGKAKARANVVLLATDSQGDVENGKWYRKQRNFTKVFPGVRQWVCR